MTTLGKILVFLVFLAALALGGLMLYVSKTTPHMAVAVKERDDYITILKANAAAEAETKKRWLNEYEKMKQLLDTQAIESRAVQARLKVEKDELEKQAKTALEQQQKSDLLAKQAQGEAERLQQELKFTLNVVTQREKVIEKLQTEIVTALNEAQAAKNIAETATARSNSLIEQLREKEGYIAKLLQKNQPTQIVARVTDPNYSNPPPVYVKGVVKEVDDKDKKLFTISVGSDNGLRKDQTLEVFRMSPKAEYLGRALIVDADFRFAVARLLPQPGAPGPVTLLPGDEVASKLRQ